MNLSGAANIDQNTSASGGQYVNADSSLYYSLYGTDDGNLEDYWGVNTLSSTSNFPTSFKGTSLFSGDTGYYDIVVGYYDENDGIAEIIVKVGSSELDRWFADENFGTSSADTNSLTTRTVAQGVQISSLDLIELTAISDNGDRGNLDYIQFIKVEPPDTTSSIPEVDEAVSHGDVLRGGAGNDTAYGGKGDDTLYGDSGNDTLYGDFTTAKGEIITVFESSFEAVSSAPLISSQTAGVYAAPLDGWSSTNGYLEVWNTQSADGSNHIELNEDPTNYNPDTSQIFRQIKTTSGERYVLSFQYAPRNGYGVSVNALEVRLGGETLLAIAEDGTDNTDLKWKTYTVSF
ncbi:MAG: hypothetical protein AAFQ57_18070, partial [Cyanobacteria bacterium J06626_14]